MKKKEKQDLREECDLNDDDARTQELVNMLLNASVADISKKLIKNYAEEEEPIISPEEGNFILRYITDSGYLPEYRIWRSYYYTLKREEALMKVNYTVYCNDLDYIKRRIKELEVYETIQGVILKTLNGANSDIMKYYNSIIKAIVPIISGAYNPHYQIDKETGMLSIDLKDEWNYLHAYIEETLQPNMVILIGQCKAVERFAKKYDMSECVPACMRGLFGLTKTDYLKELEDDEVKALRAYRKQIELDGLVSLQDKKQALRITGEMAIPTASKKIFLRMETILNTIQACENGR